MHVNLNYSMIQVKAAFIAPIHRLYYPFLLMKNHRRKLCLFAGTDIRVVAFLRIPPRHNVFLAFGSLSFIPTVLVLVVPFFGCLSLIVKRWKVKHIKAQWTTVTQPTERGNIIIWAWRLKIQMSRVVAGFLPGRKDNINHKLWAKRTMDEVGGQGN